MSIQCDTCLFENPEGSITCISCGAPLNLTQDSSTAESLLHLPSGTLLNQNKYRVEKTLGQGGFGVTYKGLDLVDGKEVAIKELFPDKSSRRGTSILWSNVISPKDQREQLDKFKIEAQYLSRCVHPNIVRIFDWFEQNNTAYIVMDFVKGKPLSDVIKAENKLAEDKAIQYFLQLTEALKLVHANNLLHRDIKPENIIINDTDLPVLIDFGNAREFIANKTQNMTEIGTVAYAPLEQNIPTGRRGPSLDFYSLGASMYETISGQLPEPATQRALSDTLIPPRKLVPSISPILEKVILTCLRMRAEDRFQTADELINALNGKFVSPSQRRSQQLVSQGKLAEAAQSYEKCLNNEPTNGEAAVELALVLTHINDGKAEKAALQAIQLLPNDGRGYGVLGLIQCRKNKWSDALKNLQQAANLSGQEAWIQANLAWALGKVGKWQEAETAVGRSLQLDPNLTFALGLQAWIYLNQQQWKSAIRASRQSLFKLKQVNPQGDLDLQNWVYPCLTIALEKAVITKQAQDVERCLQEFTTQLPKSSFAWGFLGWKYASEGRFNEAISSGQKALQQSNSAIWIYFNLGITYEHNNNIQDAVKIYKNCLSINQSQALVLFRLGTLLGQEKDWQTAKSHLQKAIKIEPNRAEFYHNLGWVLLNLNKTNNQVPGIFREIMRAYRQALNLYQSQNDQEYARLISSFQKAGINI
ncbi:serine/threonine-protein kinase [Oscillatoria acuminata]|uniref:Tetratricopeptide repeat protein,protein kinase family protein n=1 Tax=Oscillatoria acuminata PCC 6304 TaxID=56110 RepID=K9TN43_9CYAN|nr:serine/threonine-protein kinase [Oscillatoria acuminata]AFY83803.1 tetratricopeptide repeat protein,protein kinase family protein [Oscillatoria acuminata PCC 6304]